jgi:hypothetical protein
MVEEGVLAQVIFLFTVDGTLVDDEDRPLPRAELEQLFGKFMEALPDQADVAMNFATGRVEFWIYVDVSSPDDAIPAGNRIVDDALRAAGLQEKTGDLGVPTAELVPA